VCKVYDYVKGTIRKPKREIYPVSAQNWDVNNEYAKLLLVQNVSSEQLQHINQEQNASEVWKSLIDLQQARGFRTALTCMRTLYTMRASEDENILDYINKMKTLVDEINSMRSIFKINDITYAGALAQSLPPTWDNFIDNLHPGDFSDEDSMPTISIVQFQRQLKDEYYRRVRQKEDEALHSAQQSNVSVTKRNNLANKISEAGPYAPACACCKKRNHTTD
jgi:hypothetical protein